MVIVGAQTTRRDILHKWSERWRTSGTLQIGTWTGAISIMRFEKTSEKVNSTMTWQANREKVFFGRPPVLRLPCVGLCAGHKS